MNQERASRFHTAQPNLRLHGFQSIYNEAYVLVQFDSEFFHALTNIITIDRARKRLVLELLFDGRDFQIVKAARGAHQRAGYQESRTARP